MPNQEIPETERQDTGQDPQSLGQENPIARRNFAEFEARMVNHLQLTASERMSREWSERLDQWSVEILRQTTFLRDNSQHARWSPLDHSISIQGTTTGGIMPRSRVTLTSEPASEPEQLEIEESEEEVEEETTTSEPASEPEQLEIEESEEEVEEETTYCPTCEYETDDCRCDFCERCEESYFNDDGCPTCRESIRNYSFKVERFYSAIPRITEETTRYLYLGVELEVEAKNDRYDAASELLRSSKADRWCICKEDGSLNHGFEVVTVPALLDEHKKRWPSLLTTLKRGCTSWNNRTTGLHVHINRGFFKQLEIAKFVVFMNSEETRPYIVSLAGRTSPEYAALKKKEADRIDVYHSDRYEAVNLRNSSTIEVRIFKGTLNEKHVLADIEFCDALSNWVKVNTLDECDDWKAFMIYVEAQGTKYVNLIEYMKEKETKIAKMVARQFARYSESNCIDLTHEGVE